MFNFGAGLIISSNAILQGYGTILNNVTNYGTIAANQSGQKFVFDAYLSNQGQMLTTNGGGFFDITSLTRSADSAQISLKGIQGMEFALEYKNSLDNFWTTLLPFSPGTNGTMVLTDQAAPPSSRIYRVQAR